MLKGKRRVFVSCIVLGIFTYFFLFQNKISQNGVVSAMSDVDSKETLEIAKRECLYLEEYKDAYKEIVYQEEDSFIEHVNVYLNLSYTSEEINNIYKFLNEENRVKLLGMAKVDLSPYYKYSNFEVDKIPRYEAYQSIQKCSLEEAVLKVNIGLDHDFYTQIESIEDNNSYTVLVNKYHSLGEYEPSDLKPLSYDAKYQLREKARDAFEELASRAKIENVYIRPYSAYRSFTYQTSLYNTYVKRDGKNKADTYSARGGHSEHQTGLAVDVWSEGYQMLNDTDAKWLKENAYKYGFIVRYTKETENITGYIEEPWHLRYLGVEIASDVNSKNLTYDEYYDLYIK